MSNDPQLEGVFPKFYGKVSVGDKDYFEMEDLQSGIPKEDSTLMDIKIGYVTYQADPI